MVDKLNGWQLDLVTGNYMLNIEYSHLKWLCATDNGVNITNLGYDV